MTQQEPEKQMLDQLEAQFKQAQREGKGPGEALQQILDDAPDDLPKANLSPTPKDEKQPHSPAENGTPTKPAHNHDEIQRIADDLNQITIGQCHACGGAHANLQMTRYLTETPPYTHWYMCPRTKDPVGITVVEYQGKPMQLSWQVMNWLAVAQQKQNYIMFLAYDQGGGNIMLHRLQHKFSTAYFPDVQRMIKDSIEEITGPPRPVQPMQHVTPPAPTNLFGASEDAAQFVGMGPSSSPSSPETAKALESQVQTTEVAAAADSGGAGAED